MNITKNLIFCILVILQNVSYATDENNTLSEKAQAVAEFLDNFNVDQNRKNEIIAYFNQSPVGIPFFYKLGKKKLTLHQIQMKIRQLTICNKPCLLLKNI